MIDFRPVLFIIGILISTLALAMFVPAAADLAVDNDEWQVFGAAAALTLFIGVMLMATTRSKVRNLSLRQAFVLTTLSWIVMPAVAALPLVFADLDLSYTGAFFEAMSGLTTTGSTVIIGLDSTLPGVLLWRALLQWLGGIGIIVMAIAILPMLGVGGMQLFHTESSDQAEKALPRATQISAVIAVIYLVLTLAAAIAYWFAGMTPFEAVCHAMTTIATAGYSTSDASIGHFQSPAIEWTATVFMIIGGIPFILYFLFVSGQRWALWRDAQVRWFVGFLLSSVAVMIGWLWLIRDIELLTAVRLAAFNTVSVITGTGYASTDYGAWGGFAVTLLLFAMVVGGCSGSTTGGIKIFRFQMLHAMIMVQIKRLLQPHGVFVAKYNHKPIPHSVSDAVVSFFFRPVDKD